jgi:hypothetical protein
MGAGPKAVVAVPATLRRTLYVPGATSATTSAPLTTFGMVATVAPFCSSSTSTAGACAVWRT